MWRLNTAFILFGLRWLDTAFLFVGRRWFDSAVASLDRAQFDLSYFKKILSVTKIIVNEDFTQAVKSPTFTLLFLKSKLKLILK